MRRTYYAIIYCLAASWLSACGDRQATETVAVTTETTAAPAPAKGVTRYSAEAFFETTSYGLVGSAAHTFSPDGESL